MQGRIREFIFSVNIINLHTTERQNIKKWLGLIRSQNHGKIHSNTYAPCERAQNYPGHDLLEKGFEPTKDW